MTTNTLLSATRYIAKSSETRTLLMGGEGIQMDNESLGSQFSIGSGGLSLFNPINSTELSINYQTGISTTNPEGLPFGSDIDLSFNKIRVSNGVGSKNDVLSRGVDALEWVPMAAGGLQATLDAGNTANSDVGVAELVLENATETATLNQAGLSVQQILPAITTYTLDLSANRINLGQSFLASGISLNMTPQSVQSQFDPTGAGGKFNKGGFTFNSSGLASPAAPMTATGDLSLQQVTYDLSANVLSSGSLGVIFDHVDQVWNFRTDGFTGGAAPIRFQGDTRFENTVRVTAGETDVSGAEVFGVLGQVPSTVIPSTLYELPNSTYLASEDTLVVGSTSGSTVIGYEGGTRGLQINPAGALGWGAQLSGDTLQAGDVGGVNSFLVSQGESSPPVWQYPFRGGYSVNAGGSGSTVFLLNDVPTPFEVGVTPLVMATVIGDGTGIVNVYNTTESGFDWVCTGGASAFYYFAVGQTLPPAATWFK